jgi:cyclopropane-fatty-acyl-phospholipid synthase
MAFRDKLTSLPVALVPEAANEQHYEVPAAFYELVLGHRKKYSSALWTSGVASLDQAEDAMLDLTCRRAEIENGHRILELGCGWGSLTLWMAERYPESRITGVSNSSSQREYILGQAQKRGLSNIEIITRDINVFDTDERFDRVVSVEMFEHLRNYEELLRRIRSWMNPEGKLFVHIFTHARFAYEYETTGTTNWLGKYFFTGGMMPSDHLLLYFADDLAVEQHWRVNGTHYSKTAEAWYRNLIDRKQETLKVFEATYVGENPHVWFERWKLFFLACAELFGYARGNEWMVSHYLFKAR